jgi:flavin-binding protein dodecin
MMTRKEKLMAKRAEHAKTPAVMRVIELVGVSEKSWSDAAQQAVARASETLRHITGLDVLHSSAVVRDGKIVEYHVNVKIAFVIEPADIDK